VECRTPLHIAQLRAAAGKIAIEGEQKAVKPDVRQQGWVRSLRPSHARSSIGWTRPDAMSLPVRQWQEAQEMLAAEA
jgi:hypothetical protein